MQDVEHVYPFYRLQEAGFMVETAIRGKETVLGVKGVKVVGTLDIPDIKVDEFDVLVLPGGAMCLEYIRQDKEILEKIKEFYDKGKVIASICHGTQLLISAKIVRGKKISGYYSIKDDIINAGAEYIDAPVVVDGKIVTSPHYKHMADWMRETLRLLGN